MKPPPSPPPSLSLFVEVLGLDDTLRLIEAYGGTKLWVPKGIGNSSNALRDRLEQQFGKAMVKELIAGFGGDAIRVPLCQEWRTEIYAANGMTQAEIARKLGCAYETVSRRLKRARGEDVQSAFNF